MTSARFISIVLIVLVGLATIARAQTQPTSQPTGASQVVFTEQSHLTNVDLMADRMGYTKDLPEYDLSKETFELFVPADYEPGKPFGLLVWIDSGGSGKASEAWQNTLNRNHLIWVGANNSGNDRNTFQRLALALDAAFNAKKMFTIDEDRVYVSGVSGGGRCASMAAPSFPEVFQGGIFIVGCNYFRNLPVSEKPTAVWPQAFVRPKGKMLELAKSRSRFVLVTGTKDINRNQTKDIFDEGYTADHFKNVVYFEVPEMGHAMPNSDWLNKCVTELDLPLADAAPALLKEGERLAKAGKVAQARLAFLQVIAHTADPTVTDKARKQLDELENGK